jgi:23S rRNA (uracil1939-C5)-methyltransferase
VRAVRAEVEILGLAPGGEGVARAPDGRALFVPFTAPGDLALVEIPAEGDGPRAGLVEVARPGAARVHPPCGHFGPCGGCEWLHVAYEAQLQAKVRALGETLRRIGKLEPGSYEARPALASPAALRYRSRAKFHLDARAGRLVFFRRRSHEPVWLRECHLLQPELDALREAAGAALARERVPAREVTLEWSRHAGRGAAHLLLGAAPAAARPRAEAFLAAVPGLQGAVLTSPGEPPAMVGDPVLLHERTPGDPAGGLQRSRPDVFQQANRGANALLVAAAVDLLRPEGEDVLELFCGAGNFTAPLARRARSVSAVEAQGPALDLARRDAGDDAMGTGAPFSRLRFFAGDALALARAFARESGPGARRFGAALLDPPREGARGLGPALRDLGGPRAVYVSCDPATLARDLRACVSAGYRVAVVQAVDMFPQTHHVEAVALLERG